jgi:hypothetical protein
MALKVAASFSQAAPIEARPASSHPHIRVTAQQLRQLGEVHRYPQRLVARQPIGRRAVRGSNASGIAGEAEVRSLRLKRRE